MIYEVQISIFGQMLSTTVHANNRQHLAERVRDEIKVQKVREVKSIVAELAAEFNITELVR
jgi:uncharacterized protein (DUF2164 family)